MRHFSRQPRISASDEETVAESRRNRGGANDGGAIEILLSDVTLRASYLLRFAGNPGAPPLDEEIARRFLERAGLSADDADRVAIAIVLHMRAGVTLSDGVEPVLLDRATSIDVRGDGFSAIDIVRDGVVASFPRGDFDRHFLAAIRREAAIRPTCQSARLLHESDLAGWMARSPWVGTA